MLLAEIAELNGSPEVPAGTVGAVIGATLRAVGISRYPSSEG